MDYNEAMDTIGGLSTPNKMPWFSYSLSAFDCQTGSKLRQIKGSVCSKCYACKGNYCFPVVRSAHQRRIDTITHPEWVNAFTIVLTRLHSRTRSSYLLNGVEKKENRFRWHDSGDIQSLDHLERINQIALNTPDIDHWIPTKEISMVNQFVKKHGAFAPNLTVRLSATMIGQTYSAAPMGLPFSTVNVKDGVQCPASQQEGKCKDCRQCWDSSNLSVNYKQH